MLPHRLVACSILSLTCSLTAGFESAPQDLDLKIRIEAPELDFRSLQSPVKNQGRRGTCTAFAITAALETFPGIPNDLSEQFIYGIAKYESVPPFLKLLIDPDLKHPSLTREGLFFESYQEALQTFGLTYEELLPYNSIQVQESRALRRVLPKDASEGVAKILYERTQMTEDVRERLVALAKYQVLDHEVIPFGTDPSASEADIVLRTERLKAWLAREELGHQAIPVGFEIHQGAWGFSFTQTPIVTVDSMVRSMEQEEKTAKEFRDRGEDPPDSGYGGHAVTIVGYTEDIRQFVPDIPDAESDKAYWIIKNSWGPQWGNLGGYGFVSLDYHHKYALQAMLIKGVGVKAGRVKLDPLGLMIKNENSAEFKTPGAKVDPAFTHSDIHLKLQPAAQWKMDFVDFQFTREEEKTLALSTYVKEVVEPDISAVQYFLQFREGLVQPDGELEWTEKTTLKSPELTEDLGLRGFSVGHSFTWVVTDSRLAQAVERLAVRKHAGHLEVLVIAGYYEPMPDGKKVLRTGRLFVTRYVGGPAVSRDLGGVDAAPVSPEETATILALPVSPGEKK